ncbi:carbohydrate ABC transporter permease [Sanguibacter suarezii]|uniref:carbohydrate ABC transporter permease n=1 Tax=Sanguibacter suarezii TaxID=60921 RepID=UPI00082F4E71|nr:sugar ABC transporter permease [Sanguibacter suarezii]
MTTAATDVLARPPRPSSTPGSPGSPATSPPASPSLPAPRRRRSRPRWRTYLTFLLLAGPNVALLVVFVYKPLLQSFQYSTLQWNIGSPSARPVGLGNYVDWFTDPRTPQVLTTTAIFTVATVGGSLLIGLGLALLLNRRLAGRGAARTIVFAPYVLSGIAVGILWLFIFDPRYGLVSTVLGWLGLSSPDWYNDSPWALAMIIVVYLWKNVGYVALIYLAGLQAVPQELRDAAALDGAGPGRTLRSVVLPLLGPTTFFLSVTSLLSSLQSFDIIHAMTQGGPLAGTTTLMYQIYQESFVSGRAGYASAVATLLFVILAVITVAHLKLVERKVHY